MKIVVSRSHSLEEGHVVRFLPLVSLSSLFFVVFLGEVDDGGRNRGERQRGAEYKLALSRAAHRRRVPAVSINEMYQTLTCFHVEVATGLWAALGPLQCRHWNEGLSDSNLDSQGGQGGWQALLEPQQRPWGLWEAERCEGFDAAKGTVAENQVCGIPLQVLRDVNRSARTSVAYIAASLLRLRQQILRWE